MIHFPDMSMLDFTFAPFQMLQSLTNLAVCKTKTRFVTPALVFCAKCMKGRLHVRALMFGAFIFLVT